MDGGREEESNAAGGVLKMARMSEEQTRGRAEGWQKENMQRGKDVCISANGESGGGIANGLVCCNE